jgi:hypothetical protein
VRMNVEPWGNPDVQEATRQTVQSNRSTRYQSQFGTLYSLVRAMLELEVDDFGRREGRCLLGVAVNVAVDLTNGAPVVWHSCSSIRRS